MNNYKPYDFNEGNTYNERTDKFVGVDLTNPQMSVEHKRGIYSRNYMIKPSGRVETRYGYEQVNSSILLLGMWDFVDSEGNDRCVAACANNGRLWFYEPNLQNDYLDLGMASDSLTMIANGGDRSNWLVYTTLPSVWGTASQGKLWILTGIAFVVIYADDGVLKWGDFGDPDANLATHIPTVTFMGIPSNAAVIPATTFVTLEYPNILSRFRKDMYLMGLGVKEGMGSYPKINLENASDEEDDILRLEADYSFSEYDSDENTYVSKTVKLKVFKLPLDLEFPSNATIANKSEIEKQLAKDCYILTDEYDDFEDIPNDAELDEGNTANGWIAVCFNPNAEPTPSPDGPIYPLKEIHYILGTVKVLEDGGLQITMFGDFQPFESGYPNLTITYAYVDEDDYQDQLSFINGCTKGAFFGANNSLNRLWLYGNKDKPNYAIHTQLPYKGLEDNLTEEEGDYSYIPDEGMIKFGESSNEIIGMEVVSADKMMVLKNRNGQDRTVFYVSPMFIEEDIGLSSGKKMSREEFSTSLSNTETAGLSKNAILNFHGDILFMSADKQIVGLDIEGITGDVSRIANSRSRFIDKALANENMANLFMFVFNNYLAVSTDESLYFASADSLSADTRQYEWWPCDPLPGKVISACRVGSDKLYIGTNNGVFIFRDIDQNGEIYDITRQYISASAGDVGLNDGGYLVTTSAITNKLPSLKIDSDSLNPAAKYIERIADPFGIDWVYPKDGDCLKKLLASEIYLYRNNEYERVFPVIEYESALSLRDSEETITSLDKDDIFIAKPREKEEPVIFKCFLEGSLSSDSLLFANLGAVGENENIKADGSKFYSNARDVHLFVHDGTTMCCDYGNNLIHVGTATLIENSTHGYGYVEFSVDGVNYAQLVQHLLFKVPTELGIVRAYKDDTAGRFYLCFNDNGYIRKFDLYRNNNAASVTGYLETRKMITPYFVSLRLNAGKMGYDKTISNMAVFVDSERPCDLYVGSITNKSVHTYDTNKVISPGVGFDFATIDFESTDFDKSAVPTVCNLKRFPRSQQLLAICFTAKSKRNSVLGGIDILYKTKRAKNKR